MRIGVVSDTHNHLRNVERIVELFNEAAVERVIHTGDITQAKTLDIFGRLDAPLFGVYGNNDLERPALEQAISDHDYSFIEPPRRLVWAGRTLTVVHDPLEISAGMLRESDFVLHGHNHLHVDEMRNDCRVYNPGECAGMMQGLNAIGVVDLETGETDPIRF